MATPRPRPRPARPPGDPYSVLPSGSLAAPLIAIAILVVIGALTFGLMTGDLPSFGGATGNGPGGAARTPTPPNLVVVDPRTKVPGSIVYAKDGNIWIQSGASARQLTSSGHDSMPSWSPDGTTIYYVSTKGAIGTFPANGSPRQYEMAVPTIMAVKADGSAPPVAVTTGAYTRGQYSWFYFLREPVLSPDGTRLALLSDGPDPTRSDVILQFYSLATRKLVPAGVPEASPFGHQDPAWRPDGRVLLYVMDNRDGSRGAPSIQRYDTATKRSTALTGPGYIQPAWSPDARFVAATRTDTFGTDVVILDAATGSELLRLTNDGSSFAPVWSPAGDSIAYLHIADGVVDLQLIRLAGTGPTWTPSRPLALTVAAGLDAVSRPGWFIPPDQLPARTASPTTGPSGAPAGSGVVTASP